MILNALWVTLAVSALAAFLSTIMGTAAAIGFRNLKRRSRNVFMTINNIPLTNADIITGVSMMLLFVFAIGAFNGSPISQLLGVRWKMGFGTLLLAHITFDAPYVILSVMPKLRQLDPNIYEAAQDLGANSFTVFRRVTFPLSLPGVLSGVTMVFIPSVSTFVISRLLGGGKSLLLGDLIEMQFMGTTYNPWLGSAIALVMMVIVLVCMAIMNRFGEGEEGVSFL